MRLTTKTDFCLRVLIFLQTHPGKKTKIQEIADAYQISKNHLSVAVNKLSELGYVFSTPGPKGGIEFNPQCAEWTVGELVSKVEDMNIVECFDASINSCVLTPRCRLKHMLYKASTSFLGELQNYKIKDLVKS
ncbi:MAG TPA: Rrf2 family transcriptional regulator [Bacteriovoracaceae bacterium]|nr:Rrf2 family transcriptional regulator [Bacteriovoracaceae bacterium]